MKKQSRFQELANKTKAKKEEPKVEPKVTITEDELHDLLQEVRATEISIANSVKELEEKVVAIVPVVEDLGPYHTIEQKRAAEESIKPTLHPELKKAYNIYLDKTSKSYILDTVEYEGTELIQITSRKLTTSQALAMLESKKIFTDKLILKKKGV